MKNDQSYNINERNNFPKFLENRECKTKKVLEKNTKSN